MSRPRATPENTDSGRLSLRQPNAYFATLSPPFVYLRSRVSSAGRDNAFFLSRYREYLMPFRSSVCGVSDICTNSICAGRLFLKKCFLCAGESRESYRVGHGNFSVRKTGICDCVENIFLTYIWDLRPRFYFYCNEFLVSQCHLVSLPWMSVCTWKKICSKYMLNVLLMRAIWSFRQSNLAVNVSWHIK